MATQTEVTKTIEEKMDALKSILADMGSVIVAYSGGADSAFLAATAHDVLGNSTLAVTAKSPSLAPSELGQPRGELGGGVRERIGGGARDDPGHVADAVVDDAVLDVGGIRVGRHPRCLEAASLVDAHVDHDRLRLHGADHLAGHQLGRRSPGDQHPADDDVGVGDRSGEVRGV